MKQINFHSDVILAVTEKSDGNIDYRYGGKRQVDANRKKIFDQLKIHPSELIEGEQIHFTRILHLYEENAKMWKGMSVTGVDGFVTDQTDISLMMRVADCVTVVLYDPVHKALGLFHAGWKGANAGVQLEGLQMMQQNFESEPKEIVAWLGPCAQKCCYTHTDAPKQIDSTEWNQYIDKKKNLYCVDLSGYIANSLNQAGLLKKNISSSDECTIETEHYFSHRGSKQNESDLGRFAVIAQLRPGK